MRTLHGRRRLRRLHGRRQAVNEIKRNMPLPALSRQPIKRFTSPSSRLNLHVYRLHSVRNRLLKFPHFLQYQSPARQILKFPHLQYQTAETSQTAQTAARGRKEMPVSSRCWSLTEPFVEVPTSAIPRSLALLVRRPEESGTSCAAREIQSFSMPRWADEPPDGTDSDCTDCTDRF